MTNSLTELLRGAFSRGIILSTPAKAELMQGNSDDNALWCYLNSIYDGLDSFKNMIRVVDNFAKTHSFHSVQDYLNSLSEWNGTVRAEKFFVDALKVEDSYYARCVTFHWLTAAVSRIYNPDCKWDYALIIKGEQGIGKSTAFAKLGGEWFNNSIDAIKTVDWFVDCRTRRNAGRKEIHQRSNQVFHFAPNRQSSSPVLSPL